MTSFHHRFYRYVRWMLRHHPKMREERLAWLANKGVFALCGGRAALQKRLEDERDRRAEKHRHWISRVLCGLGEGRDL